MLDKLCVNAWIKPPITNLPNAGCGSFDKTYAYAKAQPLGRGLHCNVEPTHGSES